MTARRAVFLDRDGTMNVDVGFAHRVESLALLPGAVPGLLRMAALGLRLVIVTNQSGIARGFFSEAEMHAFNAALCRQLAEQGVTIDAIYFSPFHPTAGQGSYRRESPCRKPAPGMLLDAARDLELDLPGSFAIGDKLSDIAAGRAAGCRTILVATGKAGRGEEELIVQPDAKAADLLAAAEQIECWLRS